MAKGYRLVEPITLDPLFADKKYFTFAVAIFHWLIPQLHKELGSKLQDVDIEVIKVEHFGSYIALGISYEGIETSSDTSLEELVEDTIERLLRERPVIELVEFISKDDIDWTEETKKILKEY